MDIGQRIKVSRLAAGLSLRELGRRLGVSGAAVHQWESGDTRPTLNNRVDLSKELSIPFTDLLPENGVPEKLSVTDPEVLQLVQHFQKLPPEHRANYLKLVVLMTAALTQGRDQPDDLPAAS